jgi:Flp pilus assembly protein TadD
MPSNEHHKYGLYLYETGYSHGAITQLKAALLEQETSEIWNDLGFVYMMAGQAGEAEAAFGRALNLDSGNCDAAANLGALLATSQRWPAALAILEKIQPSLRGDARGMVLDLIERCRAQAVPAIPG